MAMANSPVPFELVALSGATYGTLFHTLGKLQNNVTPPLSVQSRTRIISAGHATFITLVALYVLRSPQWKIPKTRDAPARRTKVTPDGNLNDSANPLINGRNTLGNALTAWETGYLIYDTWMLVYAVRHLHSKRTGLTAALIETAGTAPAVFAHHVLLASALLYLQFYVARNQERGIWVIVSLMLSNASTPIMHLRWWVRRNGRKSRVWDLAFAAAFAMARFGSVIWIFKRYGQYHGLGPLEAYRRLRAPCRLGTAALTGFNCLWWMLLIRSMARKPLPRATK